ncbi:MAG: SAM-dependent chlorinase/fluorinase [Dehalococcoidia bacterium]|nr:SAM-dependent chlorinase/fluorinase [Dehalococcoidia bacterium]
MPTSPPIITLTTDFGWRDHYVGAVKGVILGICRNATIVDLSHHVPAQDVVHGSFVIGESHRSYPNDTVHLCVVDPGVGTDRRAVVLITPYGRFVAPDNGILTRVVGALRDESEAYVCCSGPGLVPVPEGCHAYVLNEPSFWLHPVSNTFHGRDVFGPVAAHLARGVEPADLGSPTEVLTVMRGTPPRILPGSIEGAVIYVDSFGNLVTNIAGESVGTRPLVLSIARRRVEGPARTFADSEGLMALVGSFGYLEVALGGGSAASDLGVDVGEPVSVSFGPQAL